MLTVADIGEAPLRELLSRYRIELERVADGACINGSYWGEPEAGIVGRRIVVRGDTPLHSLLHETAHLICMDSARRDAVFRDAGGDDLEESAVCYLQVRLADSIKAAGSERLMQDMDAWGYSFRLGSTARWFSEDADDARNWLIAEGVLTAGGEPTWRCRGE